jgi:hypothetical protein
MPICSAASWKPCSTFSLLSDIIQIIALNSRCLSYKYTSAICIFPEPAGPYNAKCLCNSDKHRSIATLTLSKISCQSKKLWFSEWVMSRIGGKENVTELFTLCGSILLSMASIRSYSDRKSASSTSSRTYFVRSVIRIFQLENSHSNRGLKRIRKRLARIINKLWLYKNT